MRTRPPGRQAFRPTACGRPRGDCEMCLSCPIAVSCCQAAPSRCERASHDWCGFGPQQGAVRSRRSPRPYSGNSESAPPEPTLAPPEVAAPPRTRPPAGLSSSVRLGCRLCPRRGTAYRRMPPVASMIWPVIHRAVVGGEKGDDVGDVGAPTKRDRDRRDQAQGLELVDDAVQGPRVRERNRSAACPDRFGSWPASGTLA
jgi:hypothetical protein